MGDRPPLWHIYDIDYGYGTAEFWTRTTPDRPDDVEREFMACAGVCFGIRKSIGRYTRVGYGTEHWLPSFCDDEARVVAATHLLNHNGDWILFDAAHECDGGPWKLKSEWDDWCTCPALGAPELSCRVHHFYVPNHDEHCKCHTFQCRGVLKNGTRCQTRTSSWHDWRSDFCPRHRAQQAVRS